MASKFYFSSSKFFSTKKLKRTSLTLSVLMSGLILASCGSSPAQRGHSGYYSGGSSSNSHKPAPTINDSYFKSAVYKKTTISPDLAKGLNSSLAQDGKINVTSLNFQQGSDLTINSTSISDEDYQSLAKDYKQNGVDFNSESLKYNPSEYVVEIPTQDGILYGSRTETLSELMDADVKVAIVDEAITQQTQNTKKLIGENRLVEDYEDGSRVGDINNNVSHSELVVNMLTNRPEGLIGDNKVAGPLMDKRGQILVYSDYRFNTDLGFVDNFINKNTLIEFADDGWNIVNASFGKFIEREKLKANTNACKADKECNALFKDSFNTLTDGQILGRSSRYNHSLYESDKYNKDYFNLRDKYFERFLKIQEAIKDHDLLYIQAAGNHQKEKESLENIILDSYADRLQDLYSGYLLVTSYDPNTAANERYANHCSYAKNICLAAYDKVYYAKNEITLANLLLGSDGKAKGSSFATPYVASTAALVKSVFPFLRNSEVQQILLTTAKDIGAEGVDEEFGWGLVQPQAAINGPKQLLRNFVVDFNHQGIHNSKNTKTDFYFKNPISGDKDLNLVITDSGDGRHPKALHLTADNPFQGKTIVKGHGTLALSGALANSNVYVTDQGTLALSGVTKDLVNNSLVHTSFTENTEAIINKMRSNQNGNRVNNDTRDLILDSNSYYYNRYSSAHYHVNGTNQTNKFPQVRGDYQQSSKGTLVAALGAPLMVFGTANLDGTLEIDALHSAYQGNINYQNGNNGKNTIYEAVLIAKDIKGNFSKLKVNNDKLPLFSDPKAMVQATDKGFKPYVVELKYQGLGAAGALGYQPSALASAERGASNLSYLDNLVFRGSDRSDESSNAVVANPVQPAQSAQPADTALTTFHSQLLTTNKENLKATTLSFSGSEFTTLLARQEAVANRALTSNLTFKAKEGFNVNFSTEIAVNNHNFRENLNHLALAYKAKQFTGALTLNYGNAAWENEFRPLNASYNTKGLVVEGAYDFNSLFTINAGLAYQHFANQVEREVQVASKAFSFNHKFDTSTLGAFVKVGKDFTLGNYSLLPFVGMAYDHSSLPALTENYLVREAEQTKSADNPANNKPAQTLTLAFAKQSLNSYHPLAGVTLSRELEPGFAFSTTFLYSYLPKGEFQAQLVDLDAQKAGSAKATLAQNFTFDAGHFYSGEMNLQKSLTSNLALNFKAKASKNTRVEGVNKDFALELNYNFK